VDAPESPTHPIIELRYASKRFAGRSDVVALERVNLSIARGELVSIVGPSGSGKSTLLNLIGALDRASSGDVRIDGHSLPKLSDDGLTRLRRDKIGFIFQFFNLLPSLTCIENVALPLHLRGWPRRQAVDRALELLALVQLEGRARHKPDELSGGERQRVAIARALSGNPPILLGDEPTGNLDTRTGRTILGLLRALHARLQTTIVIVTHDMSVAKACQRTITIKDGRILHDTAAGSETTTGTR
jgi:ABC-type lipoprotein export system ATPase subunit